MTSGVSSAGHSPEVRPWTGVGQLQFDYRVGFFDDQNFFIPDPDRFNEIPVQRIRHGHLIKIYPTQKPNSSSQSPVWA